MIIDVYQDTVCPWCRIGKENLKEALAKWDGDPVTVRYHTFFLNPDTPPEGEDFQEMFKKKLGVDSIPSHFFDAPSKANPNLVFNFDKITRSPNTLLSHRLVALTPEDQREGVLSAIYAAYFEHGQDIGDLNVLLDIAAAQGLDRDAIAEQLNGDAAKAEVLADAAQAHKLGITGVPFFVFDNLFGLSGAHPPETILQVMQQASTGGVQIQ